MDIKSLEKLSTKRLLAFYKAERKRQQMPSYNEDENFHVDLKDVKKLLDDREHIEKKDVSKRVS
jgi:histidine ammonia-lyase